MNERAAPPCDDQLRSLGRRLPTATLLACAGLVAAIATTPASLRAQTELRGRVIDELRRQPIANASVSLPALGRETHTDSAGRFRLAELTSGALLLVTRLPGYRPDTARLTLGADSVLEHEVVLRRLSTLAPVSVSASAARAVPPSMVGFEERRASGHGRFIDRAMLARQGNRKTGDLVAQLVPGIRVQRGRSSKAWVASGRNRGTSVCAMCNDAMALDAADVAAGAGPACFLDVYLDGALVYDSGSRSGAPLFDLNTLDPDEIEGIEVYTGAGQIPAKYNRTAGGCGVMVIWTRVSR